MDKCDAISVIKLMNHIILNCTHSWEDQKKQKENQTGPKSSSSAVSPPMEGRDERKIQFDFNKQGQKKCMATDCIDSKCSISSDKTFTRGLWEKVVQWVGNNTQGNCSI